MNQRVDMDINLRMDGTRSHQDEVERTVNQPSASAWTPILGTNLCVRDVGEDTLDYCTVSWTDCVVARTGDTVTYRSLSYQDLLSGVSGDTSDYDTESYEAQLMNQDLAKDGAVTSSETHVSLPERLCDHGEAKTLPRMHRRFLKTKSDDSRKVNSQVNSIDPNVGRDLGTTPRPPNYSVAGSKEDNSRLAIDLGLKYEGLVEKEAEQTSVLLPETPTVKPKLRDLNFVLIDCEDTTQQRREETRRDQNIPWYIASYTTRANSCINHHPRERDVSIGDVGESVTLPHEFNQHDLLKQTGKNVGSTTMDPKSLPGESTAVTDHVSQSINSTHDSWVHITTCGLSGLPVLPLINIPILREDPNAGSGNVVPVLRQDLNAGSSNVVTSKPVTTQDNSPPCFKGKRRIHERSLAANTMGVLNESGHGIIPTPSLNSGQNTTASLPVTHHIHNSSKDLDGDHEGIISRELYESSRKKKMGKKMSEDYIMAKALETRPIYPDIVTFPASPSKVIDQTPSKEREVRHDRGDQTRPKDPEVRHDRGDQTRPKDPEVRVDRGDQTRPKQPDLEVKQHRGEQTRPKQPEVKQHRGDQTQSKEPEVKQHRGESGRQTEEQIRQHRRRQSNNMMVRKHLCERLAQLGESGGDPSTSNPSGRTNFSLRELLLRRLQELASPESSDKENVSSQNHQNHSCEGESYLVGKHSSELPNTGSSSFGDRHRHKRISTEPCGNSFVCVDASLNLDQREHGEAGESDAHTFNGEPFPDINVVPDQHSWEKFHTRLENMRKENQRLKKLTGSQKKQLDSLKKQLLYLSGKFMSALSENSAILLQLNQYQSQEAIRIHEEYKKL